METNNSGFRSQPEPQESETHYSLKEMETVWDQFRLHNAHRSETHYSLKEMETFLDPLFNNKFFSNVGNPLLSERDGNAVLCDIQFRTSLRMSETHYSLKEMETVWDQFRLHNAHRSETHYSLKEMET